MSKNTPVRKATADLLSWPEYSAGDSPPHARSSARSHQPSDGISKVVFGGQVTDEEVESLNK
ncbi:DNA oxidative demethylase, partial [Tanacetum coccineum]